MVFIYEGHARDAPEAQRVAAAGTADAHAIEPSMAAYEEWNRRVEEQMKNMVWSHPKAKSYYLNSKGRNYVSCPFRLADYWSWTRQPDRTALQLT